jgi:hypothetical protein
MTWLIFAYLRQRRDCQRGYHRGKNFCAYCGKQLVLEPFFRFRVSSTNGQLCQSVGAINEFHAKRQFIAVYKSSELTVQRLS